MDQDQALKILKNGDNVFLTGSAGSGKTYLLNKFIKHLRDQSVSVGVTASTGIAATHLNGSTIHSWAGFGIKNEIDENEMRNLYKKQYLKKRFEEVEVLIIDEISMLHAHQLDMVDMICQAFKKNGLPFGGIQVVMCGDFFQLPPVTRGSEPQFAYESNVWSDMNLQICYLEDQYRQSDREFTRILNEIRSNEVTQDSIDLLQERMLQPIESAIKPTKLYTHNADVDAINNLELEKINQKSHNYDMTSSGEKGLVKTIKKYCLAPEDLQLKKGAMVMFVKNNFSAGYVNGTLGKIVDFNEDNYPIVETFEGNRITAEPVSWVIEENYETKAEIKQVPLRLAWAITIHKSQGMSLDAAEIDLSKSFVHGMGYVALSRVKSLDGIKLMGINRLSLEVNPKILEMDSQMQMASEDSM